MNGTHRTQSDHAGLPGARNLITCFQVIYHLKLAQSTASSTVQTEATLLANNSQHCWSRLCPFALNFMAGAFWPSIITLAHIPYPLVIASSYLQLL